MYKLLLISILTCTSFLFSCTKGSETQAVKTTATGNTQQVSKPTTAPTTPMIEDASEGLIYPEKFKEVGIPLYEKATIIKDQILNNSKGKYGRRLSMDCSGNLSEVFAFYENALISQGWQRDQNSDKKQAKEDFEYQSAVFLNENFLVSISMVDLKKGIVKVHQILKEN